LSPSHSFQVENAGMGPVNGDDMKQYLLSVIQPDGDVAGGSPPPPEVLQKIMGDVRAVASEMKSAGAWLFAGGLHAPSSATVVKVANGETLITDGPYIESKEHIGGFTVIRAADLDEALDWAKKLSAATTLPIEVRPFRDEH
jgi:hypothetical protein